MSQRLLTLFLVPFLWFGATNGVLAASKDNPTEKPGAFLGAGSFSIPAWFKNSFLDLRDDVAEATENGKRVMIYFHQDGCPYCSKLVNENFSQKHIVDFMNKNFDAIDINMWGDREVSDLNGKSMNEKAFAASLKVWFTPTLLFFDEKGKIALRVNGYYKPQQLLAALQYVADKQETKISFTDYYKKLNPPPTSGKLNTAGFLAKPPYQLNKVDNDFIAVLFEQKDCVDCDRLHKDVYPLADTQTQLKRFHTVRVDRWSQTPVTTPDGKQMSAKDWGDALNIAYVPTVVLFDKGKEVIRAEAFLKSFHMQSIFDYVASGGYKKETSFQRYLEHRADDIRKTGKNVDIWR